MLLVGCIGTLFEGLGMLFEGGGKLLKGGGGIRFGGGGKLFDCGFPIPVFGMDGGGGRFGKVGGGGKLPMLGKVGGGGKLAIFGREGGGGKSPMLGRVGGGGKLPGIFKAGGGGKVGFPVLLLEFWFEPKLSFASRSALAFFILSELPLIYYLGFIGAYLGMFCLKRLASRSFLA